MKPRKTSFLVTFSEIEGGNRMKKRAIIVLCLALVLTLIGCGNNAQSSDEHKCEDGFLFK